MLRTLSAGATPQLLVVDAYPGGFGGAHRVVEELDRALRDDGWSTTVALPDDGPTADAMTRHGMHVLVVPAPRALLHYGASTRGRRAIGAVVALPRYWLRLARVMRASADLVWVNDLRALLLAAPAARLARRPVVWHVHSRPRQLRAVAAAARRLADRVVVASRAAAVASRLDPGTTLELPNPVEIAATDGSARTGNEVVCVARLHPDKGVDVLVRASGLLTRRGVEHHVTIVGGVSPGEEDYARSLAATVQADGLTDVVCFAGESDDVTAALGRAAVYVQPSRSEGMPLATLEAMAVGCPVVATRAGGLPELITDGRTGLLVEPDQPEHLANAIERLLHDRALGEVLGASARTHVQQTHSREQFAARARALADSLVIRT